jgi:Ca2+-binding EF-hand superfamily protein
MSHEEIGAYQKARRHIYYAMLLPAGVFGKGSVMNEAISEIIELDRMNHRRETSTLTQANSQRLTVAALSKVFNLVDSTHNSRVVLKKFLYDIETNPHASALLSKIQTLQILDKTNSAEKIERTHTPTDEFVKESEIVHFIGNGESMLDPPFIVEGTVDFRASVNSELSVKEGDIINVVKTGSKQGWWWGMSSRGEGYFPANTVKISNESNLTSDISRNTKAAQSSLSEDEIELYKRRVNESKAYLQEKREEVVTVLDQPTKGVSAYAIHPTLSDTKTTIAAAVDARKNTVALAKSIFASIDFTESGKVDRETLGKALRAFQMGMTEANINSVYLEMDKNNDGSVDEGEFIEWWERGSPVTMLLKEKVNAIFGLEMNESSIASLPFEPSPNGFSSDESVPASGFRNQEKQKESLTKASRQVDERPNERPSRIPRISKQPLKQQRGSLSPDQIEKSRRAAEKRNAEYLKKQRQTKKKKEIKEQRKYLQKVEALTRVDHPPEYEASGESQIIRVVRAAMDHKRSLYGQTIDNTRALFEALDRDNSGKLSKDELTKGIKRLGLGLTKVQIDDLAKAIDPSEDGQTSLEELEKVFFGAEKPRHGPKRLNLRSKPSSTSKMKPKHKEKKHQTLAPIQATLHPAPTRGKLIPVIPRTSSKRPSSTAIFTKRSLREICGNGKLSTFFVRDNERLTLDTVRGHGKLLVNIAWFDGTKVVTGASVYDSDAMFYLQGGVARLRGGAPVYPGEYRYDFYLGEQPNQDIHSQSLHVEFILFCEFRNEDEATDVAQLWADRNVPLRKSATSKPLGSSASEPFLPRLGPDIPNQLEPSRDLRDDNPRIARPGILADNGYGNDNDGISHLESPSMYLSPNGSRPKTIGHVDDAIDSLLSIM